MYPHTTTTTTATNTTTSFQSKDIFTWAGLRDVNVSVTKRS